MVKVDLFDMFHGCCCSMLSNGTNAMLSGGLTKGSVGQGAVLGVVTEGGDCVVLTVHSYCNKAVCILLWTVFTFIW